MSFLYDCDCEDCKTQTHTLSIGESKIKPLLKVVETAFKQLHTNGNYKPEDLAKTKAYTNLVTATSQIFNGAITDNDIPEAMAKSLKEDVYVFSGLKTNAQLAEASRLLLTEDGKVKSFSAFSKDVESIKENYNQKYLDAEYQFAVSSAQSAGNWANISTDYDLQYRTAGDDRVRDSHDKLRDTTLPADDAFWLSYYAPNSWRCRCTAVQVRKGKFEVSDSKKAIAEGEKATTQLDKDGKNKLAIFRFNPGVQKVVFPPAHPYTKVAGAQVVREALKKKIESPKPLKTTADVSNYFSEFAKNNPEYFERGFKEIKLTSQKGVNGFTDMNGTIALKKDVLNLIKDGLNAIKRGEKTTFEQEKALSTMHHEMWHNANKSGNMHLTPISTKVMELANEFVARNTLADFMKKLGGNLEHPELTTNRINTGYNVMVRNYDQLIAFSKADKVKVLNDVKKHLINGEYDDQITGLVEAIKTHSTYDIDIKDVRSFIMGTTNKDITEEKYKNALKSYKHLFKTKIK